MASPPPNNTKTFGNISKPISVKDGIIFLFTGTTKNKAQNKAIPESLKLISKFGYFHFKDP